MKSGTTIALYLNNLDEEYQRAVFHAVRKETERLGIKLICVQGENLLNEGRGALHEFPSRRFLRLDGVLLLTSVLVDCTEGEKLAELRERFSDIPAVSIGNRLAGLTSIVIRTRRSMEALMEHLIETHGYRKFLYIGGPAEHRDNTVREHVFRSAIREKKEKYPEIEAVEANGDFVEYSGSEIVRNFILDNPDRQLDAIVAANDNMAIGAIKELRLHPGTRWHKCAVTGFDDVPQARLEKPALTTVRQPLRELGPVAMKAMFGAIRGENESVIHADSKIIVRASCGCDFEPSRETATTTLEQSLDEAEYRNILSERYLRESGSLGQTLAMIGSAEELCAHLGPYLQSLNVASFRLFVFPERSVHIPDEACLLYEKIGNGERMFATGEGQVALSELIETLFTDDRSAIRLLHLSSGEFQLGLLLWEAEEFADPFICSSAIFIGNTLHRLELLKREKERMRHLEHEVALRTADLIKTNTRLAEEANRRIKVEAEVLKISEMERLRFSLDLHDDICQRLAGISMYCKAMPSVPAEVAEMVNETLTLTRRYAHDSFPVELEDMGLDNALRGLCDSIEKAGDMGCLYNWNAEERSPLSREGNINVYRIVQEALQNSIKHSSAKWAEVTVTREPGKLTVRIKDDGVGNPLIATAISDRLEGSAIAEHNQQAKPLTGRQLRRKNGLGLTSMRYRAHQLNAAFSIESSPDAGTEVTVTIPVKETVSAPLMGSGI